MPPSSSFRSVSECCHLPWWSNYPLPLLFIPWKSALLNPCLLMGCFTEMIDVERNSFSWKVLCKCKMVMWITILLLTDLHSCSSSTLFSKPKPFRDSKLLFFLLWFMGDQHCVVVKNMGQIWLSFQPLPLQLSDGMGYCESVSWTMHRDPKRITLSELLRAICGYCKMKDLA